jgi:hypothetical protein
MQLPIDPNPIPPNGSTPHPFPVAPLRWMGHGAPPFPRCGQGHDQEGSASWSRRKGTGCQSAGYSSCACKSFLWASKASTCL